MGKFMLFMGFLLMLLILAGSHVLGADLIGYLSAMFVALILLKKSHGGLL